MPAKPIRTPLCVSPDKAALMDSDLHVVEHWRARGLAAEADNKRLRMALEQAALDLQVIQTLNAHGASDKTYLDWLRSNAREAETRARNVLTK